MTSRKNDLNKEACIGWVCLSVFVRKSASSMDVRAYFSKYAQRVSKKYRNCDVNECEFIASEVDRWELSFVDICVFQAFSEAEEYGQSWLVKK